ncbi:MAG: DUF6783 domain-containing protein [[Clostridium] symbiosum]|uniref:DUF6783 domain-containing protein n=2 Tax=Clostridium symbiosum TaxID=1512 RepID=UPI002FE64478
MIPEPMIAPVAIAIKSQKPNTLFKSFVDVNFSDITAPFISPVHTFRVRACLKIHSCHLHAPLCGIFGPNSVSVAHYASFIRAKSPTKCDAQLTESNFQTRASSTGCYSL